jgi:hypothetical protein
MNAATATAQATITTRSAADTPLASISPRRRRRSWLLVDEWLHGQPSPELDQPRGQGVTPAAAPPPNEAREQTGVSGPVPACPLWRH